MTKPERIKPSEVASETGVSEDGVAEVLEYLVREEWLLPKYIQFNTRSSGNLELPDE